MSPRCHGEGLCQLLLCLPLAFYSLITRRGRCTAEGYMDAGGVGWEVRMEPGGQSNKGDKADKQIKPA